jgi:hypothetical protein
MIQIIGIVLIAALIGFLVMHRKATDPKSTR